MAPHSLKGERDKSILNLLSIMELQKFISNALLSIVNGVHEANTQNNCFELSGSIHYSKGADGAKVDFDLSVVVEQSNEQGSEKGGGLKIQIFSAGINSQERDIQKNQSVQKIQFSVFINESKIKTPL
jgi:hypothetical protein